jgi:hypothetical protein
MIFADGSLSDSLFGSLASTTVARELRESMKSEGPNAPVVDQVNAESALRSRPGPGAGDR